MIYGKIYLKDDRQLLIEEVMFAANAFERMRGLLGRPKLQPNQAMLIKPCSSVHTVGMSYPLDLVFLSRDFKVKKIVTGLVPLRMAFCFGSNMVIEMHAGSLSKLNLQLESQLLWEKSR